MLVLSATASAADVHLKGGRNAEPAFTDDGVDETLNVAGELSGLGNGDVLVTLTAEADVSSTCTNQGGNQAPGQNPAPITVSGSQAIPEEELKNGNTPFNVTTEAPVLIIPGAPDCPNQNWTRSSRTSRSRPRRSPSSSQPARSFSPSRAPSPCRHRTARCRAET